MKTPREVFAASSMDELPVEEASRAVEAENLANLAPACLCTQIDRDAP
jgi:hypothetical protein